MLTCLFKLVQRKIKAIAHETGLTNFATDAIGTFDRFIGTLGSPTGRPLVRRPARIAALMQAITTDSII